LSCPATEPAAAFFELGVLPLSLNESLLLLDAGIGEFLNDGTCSIILLSSVGVEFLLPTLVLVDGGMGDFSAEIN